MNLIKNIKVVAINGSPRIGGNTDILIDSVLAGVKCLPAGRQAKIEKIQIAKIKINFCTECKCTSLKTICNTKDGMQRIFKKIKDADIVIVGSPIFFGSLTAQFKTLIDRFQCFWINKYIYKKNLFGDRKRRIGVFVSCAVAKRSDFFNNAKAIVKNFFATINVDYKFEIFCPGVEKKGDILRYPEVLKKAFKLGEELYGNRNKI